MCDGVFSQSLPSIMIIFYKLSPLGFSIVSAAIMLSCHTQGQLFANIIVLLMKTNSILKLLMEMFMQDVSADSPHRLGEN